VSTPPLTVMQCLGSVVFLFYYTKDPTHDTACLSSESRVYPSELLVRGWLRPKVLALTH
jgi:hypothetical protein